MKMQKDKGSGKKILVVDAIVPTPDQDAGSLRMYNLLRVFTSLSHQVTFAAGNLRSPEPYTGCLRALGVNVLAKPGINSIDEFLHQEGSRFDVVILSRVSVAARHIGWVRRYAPQAQVIFDTVDLHYVREYRGAKVTGNMNLLKQALHTKSQELAVAKEADCTLVVSPTEKAILEKECPGINVQVISTVHETYEPGTPFARRRDILFIGSFDHHPNVDAMLYFSQDIYPLLRDKIAGVKVYIIGGNPPDAIQGLDSENVIVTGYVPDVTPYFDQCKLSIAPLRYGAGMKGKVHLSMSYGVPVVASSVAAEGMPFMNGKDGMIADTPDAFCDAIVDVYQSERLWKQLSANGRRLIKEQFSFEAARSKLIDLL